MIEKLSKLALRRTTLIAGALVALVAGLVVSFGVTRWLTRDLSAFGGLDEVRLEQARLLRESGNEAAALSNAYLERLSMEETGAGPHVRRWINQEFRPQAKTLTARMDDAARRIEALPDVAVYVALRHAIERLGFMATHPEDRALRRSALTQLADALDAAEAHIAALGAQVRLDTPAHPLHFTPAREMPAPENPDPRALPPLKW